MKNKGIIISIIIISAILVSLIFTIFLFNFSDNSFIPNNDTEALSIEEYVETTEAFVEKKPDIGYSISHYIFNEGMNVDIEYPVVYGMENEEYQTNINNKLNINATSILLLHEDKDKIDKMNVTCTVQDFNDEKITVTYEGVINYKETAVKTSKPAKKSSTTKSKPSSNTGSNQSVDPNYDTYGGVNANPSFNYDQYQPISGQNNIDMSPMSSGIVGFASTKVTSRKIFYTSTVDMTDCTDVALKDNVNIDDLVKYIQSDDAEIVDIDEAMINNVKKYIKKIKSDTLKTMLNNADFQNTGLKSWPKCFSYVKNDNVYVAINTTSDLSDYAIYRYNIK